MTTISSDALVSSIQSEIQRVQDDLIGVEENLKRLTGRDFNAPRGERRTRQISTGEREEEPPPKRRPPGGVFARLGDLVTDAPRGRRVHEVLEDGEIPRQKPSVASSVARPINDGKSRTEAAAELTRDRASRDRNRRMFGALLGTLQRFRTEEAKQKDKDEQRAKIERKLEEKGRAEKEELRKERIELINQRKERQFRIERLNFKIERVKEHEAWEAGQRRLGRFIRTQSKPRIFWLPKINSSRTSALVSQTKHAIERELEEARLRLKDELDEVLGGRINYSFKATVKEREREVVSDDFNNGSDLLDYDAEEGELVYDDLLLSGKQKQKGIGSERRVVVQVDSDVSRAPQRRVELVTVVAERGRRVKEVEENESEKENVIKSKVNVEHRKVIESKQVIENGGDKGRVKEKEKKKEKEKDKSRGKEKRLNKKVSPEKHHKSHSSRGDSSKKESKSSRKEKKKEETVKTGEAEKEKVIEDQAKNNAQTDKSDDEEEEEEEEEKVASDANVTNEEENSMPGTEDLSQISLPLEPEPENTPKITEVVVQHVPLNDGDDDSQNTNEEEMQVETVLIDTSQIKQDKTEWEHDFPILPIVIKKEKDATPEKPVEENREVTVKPREEKKEDSSSDSSDSDSDSSAESEDDDDDDDDDESSSEDSSSDSSSSDEEDRKKKRKDKEKEKDKGKSKRKEQSSSSESSESDDSESESDSSSEDERKRKKKDSSEDERKRKKKEVEKRKPSPKYSRRSEKEKESDRKKVERKKDARKSRSRSRSRGRRSRSRSRDRRRVRSRSRERRRDRR